MTGGARGPSTVGSREQLVTLTRDFRGVSHFCKEDNAKYVISVFYLIYGRLESTGCFKKKCDVRIGPQLQGFKHPVFYIVCIDTIGQGRV